jgi:hypothetical protein
MDSPIFTRFTNWWHNLLNLYNQTHIAQGFATHIGCPVLASGEARSSSLSMSDDGFGPDRRDEPQSVPREATSNVHSSVLVFAALNVKPLRSVPQIVTRSQQTRTPPPSPSGESLIVCVISTTLILF